MSIRSLDKAVFKKLSEKAPSPWLKDAFVDWCVMVIAMYTALYFNNVLAYVFALFVLGNRQHALAILGHDGTHFTLFRSKKLNDAVTNVCAFFPVGLTASGYRNLHFLHHKHTNTAHDPELMHRGAKAPQWDLPNTPKNIFKYAVWDLFGYSLSDYAMIIAFSKPSHKSSYAYLAAYHIAFISISVAVGLWQLPLLWYGALVTTFMMFFRLRTWLEHQGSDDTHRLHLSFLEGVVLSPHNAWYHYEHHHWPSVPYSKLPELRKSMKDKPIITLSELLAFYKDSSSIRSGTALKAADVDGTINHNTKIVSEHKSLAA
jgi:fatty acid desaturase